MNEIKAGLDNDASVADVVPETREKYIGMLAKLERALAQTDSQTAYLKSLMAGE